MPVYFRVPPHGSRENVHRYGVHRESASLFRYGRRFQLCRRYTSRVVFEEYDLDCNLGKGHCAVGVGEAPPGFFATYS